MISRVWTHRVARGVAALAVVVAVSSLGAGPASAHSQLTDTTPLDGAVLAAPPPEVRLTFDSPLLDDTDTISINDDNGNVVKSIHPKPEGDSVAIPWPDGTPPGVYQVAYRVVCGDGHPVVGALSITITGAAAGASVAPAASTQASVAAVVAADQPPSAGTSGSLMPMLIGVGILAVGVIALVFALMTRRRTASTAGGPQVTTP